MPTIPVLFDFTTTSNLANWRIVNDDVMGGRSNGNFSLNDEGHGVFSGVISLENNGGFSSVRYNFKEVSVSENSKIGIRLKGDGKQYQFRVKHNSNEDYSYIFPFKTSGEWETVEINLKDMYPSFRGRKLDRPNFSEDSMEELVFLIGNKKEETFKLLLDKIELK
ncbi:CIA30 family protein [Rasiella sp. SM2506]|uniref:CIA30 family protein n=1 Tax=Rasiella sp. SM2506 TaxID=3423914 RepID=UPI003D7B08E3